MWMWPGFWGNQAENSYQIKNVDVSPASLVSAQLDPGSLDLGQVRLSVLVQVPGRDPDPGFGVFSCRGPGQVDEEPGLEDPLPEAATKMGRAHGEVLDFSPLLEQMGVDVVLSWNKEGQLRVISASYLNHYSMHSSIYEGLNVGLRHKKSCRVQKSLNVSPVKAYVIKLTIFYFLRNGSEDSLLNFLELIQCN